MTQTLKFIFLIFHKTRNNDIKVLEGIYQLQKSMLYNLVLFLKTGYSLCTNLITKLVSKSNQIATKAIQIISFSGLFIQYECKIFRKTHISCPLICTRPYAYQGVRNNGFSENFAYLLNGRSLINQLVKVMLIDWISSSATFQTPENFTLTKHFAKLNLFKQTEIMSVIFNNCDLYHKSKCPSLYNIQSLKLLAKDIDNKLFFKKDLVEVNGKWLIISPPPPPQTILSEENSRKLS